MKTTMKANDPLLPHLQCLRNALYDDVERDVRQLFHATSAQQTISFVDLRWAFHITLKESLDGHIASNFN